MKNAARLGEHSGMAQTLVNLTPACAILARFGVEAAGVPPKPNSESWSMPTSSRMTNRILGLLLCATAELKAPGRPTAQSAVVSASACGMERLSFLIIAKAPNGCEDDEVV